MRPIGAASADCSPAPAATLPPFTGPSNDSLDVVLLEGAQCVWSVLVAPNRITM
jgi:hypothetical protein